MRIIRAVPLMKFIASPLLLNDAIVREAAATSMRAGRSVAARVVAQSQTSLRSRSVGVRRYRGFERARKLRHAERLLHHWALPPSFRDAEGAIAGGEQKWNGV